MSAIDVDAGRILVRRADGHLLLLRASGAILHTFRKPVGPLSAKLDGPRLVIQQGDAIRLYGVAHGQVPAVLAPFRGQARGRW